MLDFPAQQYILSKKYKMLPCENVHKQLPYLFAQSSFRGHLMCLEVPNICYLIHPLLQDYHNTLLP